MKAVVVDESLWGNTAAVARAIAAGIGPQARALSTAEAGAAELAGVDGIVAGAPVLGFKPPTDKMRDFYCAPIRAKHRRRPTSHSPLRSWLAALLERSRPRRRLRHAGPRPRLRKAAPETTAALERAGHPALAEPHGFIVTGRYGPLRDGELARARLWGRPARSGDGGSERHAG